MRGWRMEDRRWQRSSDGQCHPPSSTFYSCFSFNFEAVVLNNRVAQKFVRGVVQRLLRGGLVGARREFDLDVLPDVHGGDAPVTHLLERVPDGFALRIHHGLLWSNDDFRFHLRAPTILERPKESCEKTPRRASH